MFLRTAHKCLKKRVRKTLGNSQRFLKDTSLLRPLCSANETTERLCGVLEGGFILVPDRCRSQGNGWRAHLSRSITETAKGDVMKRRSPGSVKTLVLALFGLLLIGLGTNHTRLTRAEGKRTFTLDVAEDCNDFARNAVDPNEDPDDLAVGDTVIVGGPIFPGG